MKLYAWIGEDEYGSGEIGLKQARVPAGYIPLVSLQRDKVDRIDIRKQLQIQANMYGKTIRLVEFSSDADHAASALVTLDPKR